MVTTLVMGMVLAAGIPSAGDRERAAYEDAQTRAGRDPSSQIRLALWCEAHGLEAERARHLALALASDPTNAVARGLLGLVAYRGSWKHPDDVAAANRSDESFQAVLAQYNARREGMPETASAHWELALWCEAHGLQPESRAHLAVVTRLDPQRTAAWQRLGYRKYHGRWLSEAEITADLAEGDTQERADGHWETRLKAWWKEWLAEPERRPAVEAAIGLRLEPRAVPTVRRLFLGGTAEQQQVGVALLDRIDSVDATNDLARLAVLGRDPAVRDSAVAALGRRDPNEVMEPLIGLMHDPLRIRVSSGNGRAVIGELSVEDERLIRRKVYVQKTDSFGATTARGGLGFLAPIAKPVRRRTAGEQVRRDLRAVNDGNAVRTVVNNEARLVLYRLTGEDQGSNPDSWRRWVSVQRGYAYAPSTEPKPVITRVSRHYNLGSPLGSAGYHHNCFSKGTTVRTALGLEPIDALHVGDQVLAADPATGALSFQPVLAALHNPPSPTLRIQVGTEQVVSTPIHRFWLAGRGWVLARDLKVGDSVRVLGGVAQVASVESDAVQPVYNLELAAGHTFFVGQAGALVHDNSRADAVTSPFDAPLALAEGAGR